MGRVARVSPFDLMKPNYPAEPLAPSRSKKQWDSGGETLPFLSNSIASLLGFSHECFCYQMNRLFRNIDYSLKLLDKKKPYHRIVYNVLNQYQSQWRSKVEKVQPAPKQANDASNLPSRSELEKENDSVYKPPKYSSDEDETSSNEWKSQLAWLTKAVEPAVQLSKWAMTSGTGNKPPPSSRSLTEILAIIQRSNFGLQDWSLGDLTIGLYLIYLQQASVNPFEDVKGVQVSSDTLVQDLIYHIELAKGAYRDTVAGLAKNSMLRERNVVKFVKNSSVLRPGYYIGIDTRNELVVLGIRGTHTVYDLITDMVSSTNEEITFEGYSSHFGTAEAARWFLCHEMGTIKTYLDKHEGYRLRLVGHSLGGAIASLLAIMLRKKSSKELGFSPDIVSAVGYGTPPCLSRELAESCSNYVTTVVMQDDIVPRLSAASLTRLRNEILQTDWMTVLEKEDWTSVVNLVTNAKQVVSSVQDVARKLADYAKFSSQTKFSEIPDRKDSLGLHSTTPPTTKPEKASVEKEGPEELFVPGKVYYLKRNIKEHKSNSRGFDSGGNFTLWERNEGEHFRRILLSSNLISDHKCDSHFYALRDVLKGLPRSSNYDAK